MRFIIVRTIKKIRIMEKNYQDTEAEMASQTGMLIVESFLQENYLFRRNVLNGKVEFVKKSAADEVVADHDLAWRPLTEPALKSIIKEFRIF